MTDFPSWVGHVADIAQIVGIVVAGVALWIAANQLSKAAKAAENAAIVAEAQAVLALDQVFAQQRW